ncbi:hypothetical protein JAAARDRAFT_34699 [Jaapia argillacea MUCL 33604]|uniref:FAD dependent oxidoreductase domain-containing protein n=1 Tax=Jaapia argillacea MUCL 33604 TaxID=933084 RepID=A0A067PVL1_9AGAM|nr:hypothetical protein JAAARDRAFT_34699 [Jaapia argillacea MUCL 33604]
MPSVIIIGAGVTGLSIAHSLPRSYDITIVARDLPGDEESLDWASPWAGAGFGGGGTKVDDALEREVLKSGFRYFWGLAESHPESSVRRMPSVVFRDDVGTDEDLWWKDFMPDYKILPSTSLPPESHAKIGIQYTSVVFTPSTYLEFLYGRLKEGGVKFVRRVVGSLAEFESPSISAPSSSSSSTSNTISASLPPADIVINATGVGSLTLGLVEDKLVEPVRGQTVLIRAPEVKTMYLRIGKDYCYVIPRGDGSVVLGGIKGYGETDGKVDPEQREDVLRRAHELEPLIPPSSSSPNLEVIRDIVGIRPGRKGGMRLEGEVLESGLKVVHAYGMGGVGFAMSAGVGKKVADLVDEFLVGDKAGLPKSVVRGEGGGDGRGCVVA